MRPISPFGTALVLFAFVSTASAQVNQKWCTFEKNPNRLVTATNAITDGNTEVDYAVADMNLDAWPDVVCVRKEKGSSPGHRPNVLLVNEGGVLTDRTAALASASDVPGDQGFLTPTNDRGVVAVDLTGDGLPDVATATTISFGDPKAVSHPRVYRNLGFDPTHVWLGIKNEDARVPQLFTTGGIATSPDFCEITAGDADQDGDLDLYFADYDSSAGGSEPPNLDLNDRFLLNDGLGFFTDDSLNHFTQTELNTGFGLDCQFIDLNMDGKVDLIRGQAGSGQAMYNSAPTGNFKPLAMQDFASGSSYGIGMGDLNNDGRPDAVFSDDSSDNFRLNNSTDAFGKVVWGNSNVFHFVGGSDDGFAHNSYMADFDGDGWNEIIICDFDVDVNDCGRRMKIYHNRTAVAGGVPQLWEEAESTAAGSNTTWKSAVGMYMPDMRGTFDVALADFDRDGDLDMLQSRCNATTFWENKKFDPVCQSDLGSGGPGDLTLAMCGQALDSGKVSSLRITNGEPSAPAFLFAGLVNAPTFVPALQGTIVPIPPIVVASLILTGDGKLGVDVPGGGGPFDVFAQVVAVNPAVGLGYEVSNAIQIHFGP